MLRIPCPFCGLRDHSEFDYAGDANVAYPALGVDVIDAASPEQARAAHRAEWSEAVYLRDDPKGRHRELWRHTRGCRSWLVVERDTVTHEIISARLAHPGYADALES